MYESYEEKGSFMCAVDKATGFKLKMRIEKLKQMKSNIKPLENCEISVFCRLAYEAKSVMEKNYRRNEWMKKLYVDMKEENLLTHLSVLIIQNIAFDKYAIPVASIGTSIQGWYEWLFCFKGGEQIIFDSICQKLLSYVYVAYELSVTCGKVNTRSCFWVNIKYLLAGEELDQNVLCLFPNRIRTMGPLIILIYILIDTFWNKLDSCMLRLETNSGSGDNIAIVGQWDGTLEKDQENREIFGFFMSTVVNLLKNMGPWPEKKRFLIKIAVKLKNVPEDLTTLKTLSFIKRY